MLTNKLTYNWEILDLEKMTWDFGRCYSFTATWKGRKGIIL